MFSGPKEVRTVYTLLAFNPKVLSFKDGIHVQGLVGAGVIGDGYPASFVDPLKAKQPSPVQNPKTFFIIISVLIN